MPWHPLLPVAGNHDYAVIVWFDLTVVDLTLDPLVFAVDCPDQFVSISWSLPIPTVLEKLKFRDRQMSTSGVIASSIAISGWPA